MGSRKIWINYPKERWIYKLSQWIKVKEKKDKRGVHCPFFFFFWKWSQIIDVEKYEWNLIQLVYATSYLSLTHNIIFRKREAILHHWRPQIFSYKKGLGVTAKGVPGSGKSHFGEVYWMSNVSKGFGVGFLHPFFLVPEVRKNKSKLVSFFCYCQARRSLVEVGFKFSSWFVAPKKVYSLLSQNLLLHSDFSPLLGVFSLIKFCQKLTFWAYLKLV